MAAGIARSLLVAACLCGGCTDNGTSVQEIEPPLQGKIDVVLLIDTSTGLGIVGQALCDAATVVQQGLQADGFEVRMTAYAVSIHRKGEVTTDPLPTCDGTPAKTIDDEYDTAGAAGEIDDDEDWGPAVSLLSRGFSWNGGAVRLIVVIVDEAPQDGNKDEFSIIVPPCNADDDVAIADAILRAAGAGVKVSVLFVRHDQGAGFESPEPCVVAHATDLVTERGGVTREVNDDDGALEDVLEDIVNAALD